MRTRGRIDANQQEIVDALRDAGATVETRLSAIGHGCPDLLCGFRQRNFAFECKPEKGRLTLDERIWHLTWQGEVEVVHSPIEALEAIGVLKVSR